MEFFPGGSLKLRHHAQADWTSSRRRPTNIFKQAATALAYMNASGWVHRDVKPDNILVNSAGEVRLIDFALAQRDPRSRAFGELFRRKGQGAGHAQLHVAGADPRRAARRPGRHLQLRRHAATRW